MLVAISEVKIYQPFGRLFDWVILKVIHIIEAIYDKIKFSAIRILLKMTM